MDANLTDATLDIANLTDASLGRATLTNASLVGADLIDATLDRVNFTDAYLRGVDLTDANLRDANLTYADLKNATLDGTNFEEATLTDANFENADLFGATIAPAKLSNADLFAANLDGAELYSARLGGAAINTETTLADDNGYCVYDPRSSHEYDSGDDGKGEARQTRKAMGAYQALEQLARSNGFPGKQSMFFTHRQDTRRGQLRIEESLPRLDYWLAELQNAVFRHGESFSRVVAWSLATMTFFSFVYPLDNWIKKETPTSEVVQVYTYDAILKSPILLWESSNHSAQLFLTGAGPLKLTGTVGEILIFAESLIAPILLALIVFVLGQRAAR